MGPLIEFVDETKVHAKSKVFTITTRDGRFLHIPNDPNAIGKLKKHKGKSIRSITADQYGSVNELNTTVTFDDGIPMADASASGS